MNTKHPHLPLDGPNLMQRWYVVVNDLIGGYAISNVDKPTSEHDPWTEYSIADMCMYKEELEHIVVLHNGWVAMMWSERERA